MDSCHSRIGGVPRLRHCSQDCSPEQLRQVSWRRGSTSPGGGTVLVCQGSPAPVRRSCWTEPRRSGATGQPIDEIGAGGYFGEIALIRRIREPASIVSRTAMTVDVIAAPSGSSRPSTPTSRWSAIVWTTSSTGDSDGAGEPLQPGEHARPMLGSMSPVAGRARGPDDGGPARGWRRGTRTPAAQ